MRYEIAILLNKAGSVEGWLKPFGYTYGHNQSNRHRMIQSTSELTDC